MTWRATSCLSTYKYRLTTVLALNKASRPAPMPPNKSNTTTPARISSCTLSSNVEVFRLITSAVPPTRGPHRSGMPRVRSTRMTSSHCDESRLA